MSSGGRDRASVLGIDIDRLDMGGTLQRVAEAIEGRDYTQHVCINAAKLVAARTDPELRRIIASCGIVNADGQAIVWASRLLGEPLPERVPGVDLMFELFALAEQRGYRPYVLGARADVLERAVARLQERHPRLQLAGWRDGYFSSEEQATVADAIRRSGADMLLVAMSSPRKELFLGEFGDSLGVPFVMGVGGAIDILAGLTRRAPAAWQRLGLEWLYRLLQEPRRMFRRYAVTNARFLAMLTQAWIKRRLPVR